jgi:hypothetical protein
MLWSGSGDDEKRQSMTTLVSENKLSVSKIKAMFICSGIGRQMHRQAQHPVGAATHKAIGTAGSVAAHKGRSIVGHRDVHRAGGTLARRYPAEAGGHPPGHEVHTGIDTPPAEPRHYCIEALTIKFERHEKRNIDDCLQ